MNPYENILPYFIPTANGKGWVLTRENPRGKWAESNPELRKNCQKQNWPTIIFPQSNCWKEQISLKNIIWYRFFTLVISMHWRKFHELSCAIRLFFHFFQNFLGNHKFFSFLIPNTYKVIVSALLICLKDNCSKVNISSHQLTLFYHF